MCCLIWAWLVALQNNYNSDTKDHWLWITANVIIEERVWNILRSTKMWHRHGLRKYFSKHCVGRLPRSRVATNHQYIRNKIYMKYNKVKCNKWKSACTVYLYWLLSERFWQRKTRQGRGKYIIAFRPSKFRKVSLWVEF